MAGKPKDHEGLLEELAQAKARIRELEASLAEGVTARDEMESLLRIKDNAIQTSVTPIALADMAGDLTYVNLAFLKAWGYDSGAEVYGRPAVLYWQESCEAEAVVKELLEAGSWEGELKAKRKDATTFECELRASVVTDDDGHPLCMMASFVDITDRKQTERELVRLERLRAR